jgi:DnaD/phage-associated family protein
MSRNGAFLMSREIFDNPIWSDPLKFRLFFFIVGNAVFSDDGVNYSGIQVKRGQFLRSLRNLQDDLTYREGRGNAIKKPPLETLRRKIKELEKEGRITTKSTEYGTLFTIVNYDKYQGFDHYKSGEMGQQWDSNGTAMGQRWDNNKNVKNIEDEEETNPVALYERNFFPLTPMQIESIWDWVDDFKGNQEVICMAIKETALKNPSSPFKYLTRILVDWHKRKLFTLEDVLKAKEQYEKSKVIHLERKKQKQEQPQGRYIPKDAVVDINAGEDPNWTWKKPF